MKLSGRYRLSAKVNLRPEHFGGILYHRERGKMYFLYSAILVKLLCSLNNGHDLDEGRTLGDMLYHIAERNNLTSDDLAHLITGLEKLEQMEVLDVV